MVIRKEKEVCWRSVGQRLMIGSQVGDSVPEVEGVTGLRGQKCQGIRSDVIKEEDFVREV